MLISNAYASAAAEQSSAGMPQFDANFFTSQFFWAVFSFLVLLGLLMKYVLPALGEILDERGNKIAKDISSAEAQRKEAEEMLAKYKQDLASANQEAVKVVEEARVTANSLKEKALSELDEELAKKKASALEEIEQLKRQTMAEISDLAIDVAMLATEKLVAKKVTKTDANKMVTEAVAQVKDAPLH